MDFFSIFRSCRSMAKLFFRSYFLRMVWVKKFRERNKSFLAHVMCRLSFVTFSVMFSHVHYQLQRKEFQ